MDDLSRWFEPLDRAWAAAAARGNPAPGPVAVLFSGGVDSGLLAWEFRGRAGVTLSTVGVPGSRDLLTAASAAPLLGIPWRGVRIGPEDVRALERELDADLDGLTPTARSVQVAFACAVRAAADGEILCGQGVDELFLGYAHFRGLAPFEAERRALADLHRLRSDDWPRAIRIARRLGRSIAAPFLAREFVDATLGIPISDRMPTVGAKPLFRAWARHRGLPSSIADRPKRALQYGSGIARTLERGRNSGRPKDSVRSDSP